MPDLSPRTLLAAALEGDVTALAPLRRQSWATVEFARQSLEPIVLRPEAVIRVLTGFREGTIASNEAQAWASFMRRGYFGGGQGPIHPLEIDYDPDSETAIADSIFRLDELGDLIDGEIDTDELLELEERLRSG